MSDTPASVTPAAGHRAPSFGRVVFLQAIGDLVIRLLNLVLIAAVSRSLGLEAVGTLTVAQSVAAIAVVVGDCGLSADGVRRTSAAGRADPSVVSQTLVAQVLVSTAASCVLIAVALLTPLIATEARATTTVLALLPLSYAANLGWVLQGQGRLSTWVASRLLAQVVTTACALIFVARGFGIEAIAASILLGQVASDAFIAVLLHREGLGFTVVLDLSFLRRISEGAGYLAYALSHQLFVSASIIVVGALASSEELGRYAVAYRIVLLATAPAQFGARALLPTLSSRSARNDDKYRAVLLDLFVAMASSACALTALVIAFPDLLLTLIFGDEAGDAASLLLTLALWLPFFYLNLLLSNAAMATSRPRIAATAASVSTLVGLAVGSVAWIIGAPVAYAAVAGVITGDAAAVVGLAISLDTFKRRTSRLLSIGLTPLAYGAVPLLAATVLRRFEASLLAQLVAVLLAVALCEAIFHAIRRTFALPIVAHGNA